MKAPSFPSFYLDISSSGSHSTPEEILLHDVEKVPSILSTELIQSLSRTIPIYFKIVPMVVNFTSSSAKCTQVSQHSGLQTHRQFHQTTGVVS